MDQAAFSDLPVLTSEELTCLAASVQLLASSLGKNLDELIVFGSVARGETWPRGMPIRSDLDLLVVTESPVEEPIRQHLLDATLPLFLECGRQISPQFRTRDQLLSRDARAAALRGAVEEDGISVFRA